MSLMKPLSNFLAALCCLLATGVHAQPQTTKPPAFVADFEQYIATEIAPNVPGAAIVIVADGKVQIMKGYGVTQSGGSEKVTPNTVFRLASVSKTIASTAAALMVHNHQLEWSTPITDTINYVQFKDPVQGKKVTLQDVLAHTSGLIPQAYTNLIESNVPYQEVVQRLRTVDFSCPPHRCYGYQNVVFSLAGDMIEAKSGKTYEAYVGDHLFAPLGMSSASFGLEALKQNENYARPHVWRKAHWVKTEPMQNYYNIAPAAGANASIKDMTAWLLAHMGYRPEVLTPIMLDQLHTKIVRTAVARSHYGQEPQLVKTWYGLGWRVFDRGPLQNFVHHGGWVQGFRTEMVFNRELNIGMVFLTNAETRLARDVTFKFVDAYLAHAKPNPKQQLLTKK